MQGTRVCAPVREDPTCRGAAGPREPWPLSLRVRSLCSAMGEATTVKDPHTEKKKKKGTPHVILAPKFCLGPFFLSFFFFFAVWGPLIAVASPVAEHGLWTRRLSGHGSRA